MSQEEGMQGRERSPSALLHFVCGDLWSGGRGFGLKLVKYYTCLQKHVWVRNIHCD